MASDIYLPALPTIRVALNTTVHHTQMSLALFMYGYAISHLIYGPLSDHLGRKGPLMVGIVIALIGSTLCQYTHSVDLFLIGRTVQGLGVGAAASLFRSILADVYRGNRLAKVGSLLNISRVFLLASAPLLGSYLLRYFGWRATFFFLVIYSGICLITTLLILKETNPYRHLHTRLFYGTAKNMWILLKHPIFLSYSFCNLLAFGGIAAWLTSLPFLLQEVVGLTPVEFGWVSALAGFFFIVGGVINAFLVERFGLNPMLKMGLLIMLSGGLIMLGFGLHHTVNTVVIMLPIIIYILGSSMVFSNAYAGAFEPFAKMAGTAGAVFGFFQILGGAIGSMSTSYAKTYDQLPLAIILIASSFIALVILIFQQKKCNSPGTNKHKN